MMTQNSRASRPQLYMDGVEYFQVRFAPPFLVRVPVGEHWLLYRVDGAPVLFSARDADSTSVKLEVGAVVAISGVLQHEFSSPGAGRIARPWREEKFDGQTVAGEALIAAGRISKTLMATMPMYERFLIIQPSVYPAIAARFARAFAWIADETSRPGEISREIIRRIAEITTLEISRAEEAIKTASSREMPNGVADQRIVRAISAFYAAPEERWSVQRLADVAGMSRTSFALRYRAVIGATPLKTIRQLRMQLASNQLARSSAKQSIGTLATTAGYSSDAAFIRAFTKEFGLTPGKAKAPKTKS